MLAFTGASPIIHTVAVELSVDFGSSCCEFLFCFIFLCFAGAVEYSMEKRAANSEAEVERLKAKVRASPNI